MHCWVDSPPSDLLLALEGALSTRSKLGMVFTRSTGGGGEEKSSRETGDCRSAWAKGNLQRVVTHVNLFDPMYDDV